MSDDRDDVEPIELGYISSVQIPLDSQSPMKQKSSHKGAFSVERTTGLGPAVSTLARLRFTN